jgi:hypothetical protein
LIKPKASYFDVKKPFEYVAQKAFGFTEENPKNSNKRQAFSNKRIYLCKNINYE